MKTNKYRESLVALMTLHQCNMLLCEPEKAFISEDDAQHLLETERYLDELEKADVVEKDLLEKCLTSFHNRITLKYDEDQLLWTRAFNIFHSTLLTKVITNSC